MQQTIEATQPPQAAGAGWRQRATLLAGLVLIALGIAICWRVGRNRGEDFAHPYVIARCVLDHRNVYDDATRGIAYRRYRAGDSQYGMFYPPSSGIAFLPFAFVSYKAAKLLWFLLLTAVLLFGAWRLLDVFAPALSLPVKTVVLGLIMCSSSIRWDFQLLQAAPLAIGLLGLFLAALASGRNAAALLLGAYVACLKITLALPFLGIALVQRRFRLAAGILVLWVVANGAGFLGMGGLPVVQGYRTNMARVEAGKGVNSPNPREALSMERLDWTYPFRATGLPLATARGLAMLLSAASLIWLVLAARRIRSLPRDLETTSAFLGPVTCLSLLAVYHHHYDASLLLVPLLVYALGPPELRRTRAVWAFLIPVAFYAGLYTLQQAFHLATRLFGAPAVPYIKCMGSVVVTIAFIASLIVLDRHLRKRPTSRAQA